jgi:3-deoxy-D-manno-octulosonic-acid transferase
MSEALARALYSLLLRLAAPAYLARLWWRGAREPAYRQHLGERLAWNGAPAGAPGALWLHAVSLGETRAAAALIDALRAQQPGLRLLLTHGTATGRDAGRALLREGDRQAWLPYDTPGAARRFLRRHRPALGVIMETEVWPNLLYAARRAGVPMVLANARLSAKSFAKGQRLAVLLHPAVARFDAVLAQTEADALRLRSSGARQVEVLGNLKFDMRPAPALLAQGQGWRAALARPVVLAAATREGEEAQLLQAWAAQFVPGDAVQGQPLLLLVPRHPQRFDEVAALVTHAGWTLTRRSQWQASPLAQAQDADVWLGDSTGEMPLYYASADVALLGGSFAPLGGQNLIEAAACGCPLLMGPHTFNFAQAADGAVQAGAAQRVQDMDSAVQTAVDLLANASRREHMGHSARAFAGQHRGAAQRMAQATLALGADRWLAASGA